MDENTVPTVDRINNPAIRHQFTDDLLLNFIENCKHTISYFKGGKSKKYAIAALPVFIAAARARGMKVDG